MWYAIQTKAGQEEAVRRQLRNVMPEGVGGDCRILYCIGKKRYMGQWHDKRERFLPGYMFLVIGSEIECSTIGQSYRPVGSDEEEILQKLTGGKNEIGMSYGVIRDGVLQIVEGVLMGMETRVKRIDRHKRKGYISITIHGEELIAEVGLEITEKT